MAIREDPPERGDATAARLREEIRASAEALGADHVGFADALTFGLREVPGRRPVDLLPGARTIIVLARGMTSGALAELRRKGLPASDETTAETMIASAEANRITHEVARLVEQRTGAAARTCTEHHIAGWNLRRVKSVHFFALRLALRAARRLRIHREIEPWFERNLRTGPSLSQAAVAAGVGYRGRNNLVVTPGWGPRVVLTAVLTAHPLPADPPSRARCNECLACARACPAGALSANPAVPNERAYDRVACLAYNLSLGDVQRAGHKCSACMAACPAERRRT